uniref:Uncharacterized protein n=1 Tax=Arundo donax TaxID=35708 RepID=A0A0A9BV35_ARUDO
MGVLVEGREVERGRPLYCANIPLLNSQTALSLSSCMVSTAPSSSNFAMKFFLF